MSHYSGGYALAIVQNGNVVETRQDGRVAVCFGSDYAIRLINRNSQRAVAKVSIDGQNVSGGGLIVNANGSVDLERPTDKPVTFRFASTESEAAASHGKAGADIDGSKGLILVEWRPEKHYQMYGTGYLGAYSEKRPSSYDRPLGGGHSSRRGMLNKGGTTYETKTCGGVATPDSRAVNSCASSSLSSGVTVEGSYSTQGFQHVQFDVDYSAQVIITSLKLMGYNAESGIPREGNKYCPSCRTSTRKRSDKYCRQCGEKF
jgi:hypothetical protein